MTNADPGRTRRATLSGFGALALWSAFAVLTGATGTMPPFQLLAVTFGLGGLAGLLVNAARLGRAGLAAALHQPPRVWAVGVGGLFGYHALYYAALRLAPPAEAGLFNYLWPLLLVLGAALGPGGRLRPAHVLGALLGFAGVVALLVGPVFLDGPPLLDRPPGLGDTPTAAGFDLGLHGDRALGDLCALAAAFVWAAYSLASRRFGHVPTAAVSGFGLAVAALAAAVSLLFEAPSWPVIPGEWVALVTLGLGPAGASFLLWDRGVKAGDLPLLAAVAYATPLVSTALLVAAGMAAPTSALLLACLLIVAGAVVAGRAA